jgi:ABC-type antimicrobial peptide transport system permease subunit
MAVGASPSEIGRLVLRQTMLPVATGVIAGAAGSLALSSFLKTLLFQVRPRDPLTIALAALTILVIAPAAILVPLLRATRVDCTIALRQE